MPDLQALLDHIDRLDQEATKGPWAVDKDNPRGIHDPLVVYPEDDGGVLAYVQPDQDDAEFIALARTALPQLAKALQAVMEIHKPFHADHYYNGMDGESLHRFVLRCDGCEESGGIEDYPCPTVQAITDAMVADDD